MTTTTTVRVQGDRVVVELAGLTVLLSDQEACELSAALLDAATQLVVSEERERLLRLAAACELVWPEVAQ
jgi:hypothetical protein